MKTAPKPDNTCRMFETPLIERFSRVHPAAPFFFWIPILGYFLVEGFIGLSPRFGASWSTALACFGAILGGMLFWSITEYVLHRFVFHYVTPKASGRRFYFVLHGVHHDFPTDTTRPVMPLGVSIPMGVAVFLLFRLVLGAAWVNPAFVGFGIGYLAYDGIHYATHHFRMTSRLGRWLKRYHMVHHHTGEQARWGVSSPLWDWVFGTMAAGVEWKPAETNANTVERSSP
ncbi:MAG: sterol desaturase family protein [Polyangiaceae bacterium]